MTPYFNFQPIHSTHNGMLITVTERTTAFQYTSEKRRQGENYVNGRKQHLVRTSDTHLTPLHFIGLFGDSLSISGKICSIFIFQDVI